MTSSPLQTLKILDFTTLLPGPFGTMLLADLGAEILRIEAPGRMDLLRLMEPKDGGESVAHQYFNRSKKSIGLDLKHEGAVEIVKDLVKSYDILVEGFRPGVMAKLGLSYEDLKKVNPKIIYVSLTGYGQTGPYANRAGHDINYQAVSGLASYTGARGTGVVPTGLLAADVAGGSMHLVAGLLAAVVHRQSSGEGQAVDVSLTDAAFSLNTFYGANAIAGGKDPALAGEPLNGGGFYDHYLTADGEYMSVGGLEPVFLERFLKTLGLIELAPKIMSPKPADQVAVKKAISAKFVEKTAEHWEAVFEEVDCCVERVLRVSQAAEHPQLKSRGMVVNVKKPSGGSQRQMACPLKFSGTKARYREAGGALGAHSDEVMAILGYEKARISALREAGALV